MKLGSCLHLIGKYSSALEYFDKAQKIDFHEVEVYECKSMSWTCLGENEKASDACADAIILANKRLKLNIGSKQLTYQEVEKICMEIFYKMDEDPEKFLNLAIQNSIS